MADNQEFDNLRKQADQLNRRLESLGGTAAKSLDDFIKSFGGGIEGAKDAIFNLREQIKGVDTDVNYFAESLAKVTKELSKQTNFNINIEKNYKSLSNLANELKNDQDLISRLDEKSLKSIEKKLEKEKASLLQNIGLNEERKQEILFQLRNNKLDLDSRQKLRKELEAIKKVQSESNNFANDPENGLDKLIKAAQDRLKYEQEINDKLGISGFLVDGIVNKFQKLGISSKFFENIKEDMRDAAEAPDSTKWSVFKVGLSSAGKGLGQALKDPLTQLMLAKQAFDFFLNAAINASKESVNLSKNLGYGAANADRVRENFVSIESSSSNLNVNTKNLSEAFNELSTSTGFVSEYSADALTTQIKLTKQLGLTGDEASGVYKFSVLTGKSSEATYQSMLKGYVATRNSLGVGVPFKAAIAEAAKVSGQLASNLGNNPETIIKAVVATRALGTSLEQAKKQGESLLDFQSSIENELKAELITGQQLNLERARAAALMGDQVTVAEELAAQGMTAAKFSGMNVIAQKSFAEALGTSSDELADQLAKREMAIASGKSLAQITAEEADSAAERQDIQTKFNAAMEKLQSIVGNLVAGPLSMLLEGLSGVLSIVNFIAMPLQWLGNLASIIGSTIGGWAEALGPFSFLLKGVAGIAILLAGYGAYAALSWIPVVGPILGAVAAAGVISKGFSALSSQKADDMISPGYGKRTLTGPEGAIKLNDKDTVIAGTDLGGGGESVKSSPSIDLSPMISAINEVTSAVNALNAKSWDVNLDGKLVGKGLLQNSYKSA